MHSKLAEDIADAVASRLNLTGPTVQRELLDCIDRQLAVARRAAESVGPHGAAPCFHDEEGTCPWCFIKRLRDLLALREDVK